MRGEAAPRAAQSMPNKPCKKPTPWAEDLTPPPEVAQLEIVVLLVEGKIQVFRDLLPVFLRVGRGRRGGALGAGRGRLHRAGPRERGGRAEQGVPRLPVVFTQAGRAAAEAITVTYTVRARRVIAIRGVSGAVYNL